MRSLAGCGALALAASLALAANAGAGELVDAWQAALQHDKELAVARAAHAAAQPRRDQAQALWRPNVGLTASAGFANSQTEVQGAQFSAPGFGTSSGVGFSTSINGGTAARVALQASQPLYNPQRRADQRLLALAADSAEIEWQAANQTLILHTARRYFDLALAEESRRVLERQLRAVLAAANEAEDRFKLGAAPVTDTYEARARLAAIRAQLLAAGTDVDLKRQRLADSIGANAGAIVARLPAGTVEGIAARPLEDWLAAARESNPGVALQRLAGEVAVQRAAKYATGASAAIDLVAQASRDRASGNGDFGAAGNTAANAMIGVQLTVPLFTGGMRDAQEQEAQRRVDQAAAELDRTREQVAQQVRAAWLGLESGALRVRALEQALEASESRLDATRTGHEVGERTTLDLLNAENDRAAARLALAQARVGLWLDRLELAALAGQLDETALRAADADLGAAPAK